MKKINHSISAPLHCEFEVYNFVILECVRNKGIRNHENFPVTDRDRGKNILTQTQSQHHTFVLVKKIYSSNN
jgi:hypothetical protein